ncbi:MAG: low molecular weight phosphotyrosine protein phosphatase [Chlorobiaceae bacterium]
MVSSPAGKPVNILFVCHENFCRSPMAEGIFLDLLDRRGLLDCFAVGSAGVAPFLRGVSPDERAVDTLMAHGIDISGQRASAFDDLSIAALEWVFVMDEENREALAIRELQENGVRLHMVMDFVDGREVPDPYYSGSEAFERVAIDLFLASERILEVMFSHYPYLAQGANCSN